MLQVALTGGIGSGKSLAAEYFAELGAAVIDFDQLARDVIDRGSEGFNEVLARFGDDILVEGGIDRKKLATIIFSDPQARADLEAIVHPRIRTAYAEFLQAQSGDAIVIAQIPLLAESTHEYAFDLIITMSADREIRMARLRDRGMKDFQIAERMAVQASDEQRETIAQIVINNSGSSDELLRQVENIYEDRLKPMSRITEDQGE